MDKEELNEFLMEKDLFLSTQNRRQIKLLVENYKQGIIKSFINLMILTNKNDNV